MGIIDLPLFPLATVLFPGGRLDLRIFEPRYLDLIRDCARDGSAFGICLILDGDEVGAPARSAAVGTLAHIVDFHTLPDGLLGISVQGGERFEVDATQADDKGLLRGEARFWPAEAPRVVPAEYGLLATLLERMLEQMGGVFAQVDRACYDDASWVGFRLAETLPLSLPEKQGLLQMTDPLQRLAQLTQYLPRFQRG